MKKISGLRAVVFTIGLGCSISLWAQQAIQVPDVKKQPERMKILVLKPNTEATFTDQEKITQELYELFLFDLRFSDVFSVLEGSAVTGYLERQDRERNAVDFGAWRQIEIQQQHIDYLVKTNVIPRGPGFLELDLLVYDVVQGQRMIGQAYGKDSPFAVKDLRRAGHRATAEIIRTLTQNMVTPITETRIAFVIHVPAKRTKEIYVMDYDGKNVTQVTSFNSVTLFPAWSPDGAELAYVSYKGNWPDAYLHHLASGRVSVLARFEGTNTTPRWFPDGKELVISLSAPGNPEIYRIPKSGKDPKRLTFNRWIDEAPDVSPRGNQIAFTSDRLNENPQIYIMDVDGANTRRISYVERKCDTPVWSPVPIGDDYRLAFTGYTNYGAGQADIYTVRPDGSDTQMMTDGNGRNENPAWSPDGKYIAFSSNRLGKYEIFLTSSDPNRLLPNGQKFYRLTFGSGENLSPAWSLK